MPPPLNEDPEAGQPRFLRRGYMFFFYLAMSFALLIVGTRIFILIIFAACMAGVNQDPLKMVLEPLTDGQVTLIAWFASVVGVLCWMITLIVWVATEVMLKLEPTPLAIITRDRQNNIHLGIMGSDVNNYNVNDALILLQLRALHIQELRHLSPRGLRARGLDTENLERLITMTAELLREVQACTAAAGNLFNERTAPLNPEATEATEATEVNTNDNASNKSVPTEGSDSEDSTFDGYEAFCPPATK